MKTLEEQLAEAKDRHRRESDSGVSSYDEMKDIEDRIRSIELRIARIRLAQEAFQDACAMSPSPDLRGTTYRLFLEDALRRA